MGVAIWLGGAGRGLTGATVLTSWMVMASLISVMSSTRNSSPLGLAPTEGPNNSAISSKVRGFIHRSRMHGLKRLWVCISPLAHHRQSVWDLVSPEQLLALEPALSLAIQPFAGNQQGDARWVRAQQLSRDASLRVLQRHLVMRRCPRLA